METAANQAAYILNVWISCVQVKKDWGFAPVLSFYVSLLGYIKRGAAAKRGLDKGLPAIVNQPYEEISIQYRSVTQKILSYIDKGENNHG